MTHDQLKKRLELEREILTLEAQINQALREMLADLETYLEQQNELQWQERHRQKPGPDSARQKRAS